MAQPGRRRRRPRGRSRSSSSQVPEPSPARPTTAAQRRSERLLPSHRRHHPDHAQTELAVPPRRRVHAVVLEGASVGGDRLLLGARQTIAVQGQVPGQLPTRRRLARDTPSRARSCGRRDGIRGCRASSRRRRRSGACRPSPWRGRAGSAWMLLTRSNSGALRSGNRGHPAAAAAIGPGTSSTSSSRGDRRRSEPHESPGRGPAGRSCRAIRRTWRGTSPGARRTDRAAPPATWRHPAARGRQPRSVIRIARRAAGPSPSSDIATTVWSMTAGASVVQTGLPGAELPVRGVAGAAHDPVLVGGQHLEEVALAVDDQALELGPDLPSTVRHRRARRGAGDELVDRVSDARPVHRRTAMHSRGPWAVARRSPRRDGGATDGREAFSEKAGRRSRPASRASSSLGNFRSRAKHSHHAGHAHATAAGAGGGRGGRLGLVGHEATRW